VIVMQNLTRKWRAKADEIDRRIAEYDPSEKDFAEVWMMEAEAETLRQCANELYQLNHLRQYPD
jgi:hypothetical protein